MYLGMRMDGFEDQYLNCFIQKIKFKKNKNIIFYLNFLIKQAKRVKLVPVHSHGHLCDVESEWLGRVDNAYRAPL